MAYRATARRPHHKAVHRAAKRRPSALAKVGAVLAAPVPDVELLIGAMANPDSGIKFVLGIAKKAGRRVSEVQSVIFDKLKWTADAAKGWLKDHGFTPSGKDEAATFWRFRQQSPGKYKEFRTIVPGTRNPRYEHPAPMRDWRSEVRSQWRPEHRGDFWYVSLYEGEKRVSGQNTSFVYRSEALKYANRLNAANRHEMANPHLSVEKTWARQEREQYGPGRYQVSIHHPAVPTRVLPTLAAAKSLVKKAKSYAGSAYDIYDRQGGKFLESGFIGRTGNPQSRFRRTNWVYLVPAEYRFADRQLAEIGLKHKVGPEEMHGGVVQKAYKFTNAADSKRFERLMQQMYWIERDERLAKQELFRPGEGEEMWARNPESGLTAPTLEEAKARLPYTRSVLTAESRKWLSKIPPQWGIGYSGFPYYANPHITLWFYKDHNGVVFGSVQSPVSKGLARSNPDVDVADAITSYDEHLGMTSRPEFQEATPDEQAAAMTAMDLAENPNIPTPVELQPPFSPARVRDFGLTLVHQLGGEPRNYLHEVGVRDADTDAIQYLSEAGYSRDYGWKDRELAQWWAYRKQYPLSVSKWGEQVGSEENPIPRMPSDDSPANILRVMNIVRKTTNLQTLHDAWAWAGQWNVGGDVWLPGAREGQPGVIGMIAAKLAKHGKTFDDLMRFESSSPYWKRLKTEENPAPDWPEDWKAKVDILLRDWHEAGRAFYERAYPSLNYDQDSGKLVTYKQRWAMLDQKTGVGRSGAFMLDRESGNIYRIKSAYGVPNYKKLIGHISTVTGQDLNMRRWNPETERNGFDDPTPSGWGRTTGRAHAGDRISGNIPGTNLESSPGRLTDVARELFDANKATWGFKDSDFTSFAVAFSKGYQDRLAQHRRKGNPGDLGQLAFDAAKDFRLSGAYSETGVANARVASHGFSTWYYKNLPMGNVRLKTKLKKNWMEGWAAGKRVEKKRGNPESAESELARLEAAGPEVAAMASYLQSRGFKGQLGGGGSIQYWDHPISSSIGSVALFDDGGWTIHFGSGRGSKNTMGRGLEELKRSVSKFKNLRKANPESSAAQLYEDFHGRPPEKITEVVTERHEHEWLTQLGALVELKVATVTSLDATIGFNAKEAPDLCSSEDGRQLYIEGGDQELDLGALKMSGDKWLKDSMVIGVLYELTYQTEKGFHKFKLTEYYHKLGEETGVQPTLIYDPNNQSLTISGGQYQIKPEGIVN